jgi:4-hydroxy-tetrahydrodipicolinate synthase
MLTSLGSLSPLLPSLPPSLPRCGGVLVLPPFYYKGVSEEGVYRYYASVIEQVADERYAPSLLSSPPRCLPAILLPSYLRSFIPFHSLSPGSTSF